MFSLGVVVAAVAYSSGLIALARLTTMNRNDGCTFHSPREGKTMTRPNLAIIAAVMINIVAVAAQTPTAGTSWPIREARPKGDRPSHVLTFSSFPCRTRCSGNSTASWRRADPHWRSARVMSTPRTWLTESPAPKASRLV